MNGGGERSQTEPDRATWAGMFVIQMFDAVEGKFWDATISRDVITTNSVPLDAQAVPWLTLARAQQVGTAAYYVGALRWAETVSPASAPAPARAAAAGESLVRRSSAAVRCLRNPGHLEPASAANWRGRVRGWVQALQSVSLNGKGALAPSSDDFKGPVFIVIYHARQVIAPTARAVLVKSLLSLR
jgi:hypothetical protein